MARKKEEVKVEEIKKTEHLLVVKPRVLLDEVQLELLSEVVKKEEERAGVKIVLLPASVDLVGMNEVSVEPSETENKEPSDSGKESDEAKDK